MQNPGQQRLVPVILAIALLGVLLAAVFVPALGIASADSSCPYNNCSSSPSFWQTNAGYATIAGLVLAVIIALAVAGLLLSRRGKGGDGTETSETPAEPEAGSEGDVAAEVGTEENPMEPPAIPESESPSMEETASNLEDMGQQQ